MVERSGNAQGGGGGEAGAQEVAGVLPRIVTVSQSAPRSCRTGARAPGFRGGRRAGRPDPGRRRTASRQLSSARTEQCAASRPVGECRSFFPALPRFSSAAPRPVNPSLPHSISSQSSATSSGRWKAPAKPTSNKAWSRRPSSVAGRPASMRSRSAPSTAGSYFAPRSHAPAGSRP